LQDALDAKSDLDSPQLTGTPLCPTATSGSSQYHVANKAYVATAIAETIDSAPSTLNTLNELAAALGDDPNFAATITALIGGHTSDEDNPHSVTKAQIGLGNVPNESKATMFTNPAFTGTPTIDGTSIFIAIASFMHPVGSIFETKKTGNPNTYFGFGTWAYLGEGRVTVCINSSDTAFDTIGETGGAKTHTLTTAEIPAHNHTIIELRVSNDGSQATNLTGSYDPSSTQSTDHKTSNTGGGAAHNNLQPYIVVHRWERTA
jgi:microcystin-dependent protein